MKLLIAPLLFWGITVTQRLSSAAFEATPVFATAKMGGGSNVGYSDLLGPIRDIANYASFPLRPTNNPDSFMYAALILLASDFDIHSQFPGT